MTDDRLPRMKALVAALGGREALCARLGVRPASIKAALNSRVFSPLWVGPMLDLAAKADPPVPLPADLFGVDRERQGPAGNLTVTEAASGPALACRDIREARE